MYLQKQNTKKNYMILFFRFNRFYGVSWHSRGEAYV